jgi:hypothetical protein
VATLPDQLDRKTHVELYRRDIEPTIRLVVVLVFLGISAAGLANVFGQRTSGSSAESPAARLDLEAPHAARGGLIYQVHFRVEARQAIEEPELVLDPGWFEGLTINTVEPEPVEWRHVGGRNVLVYGPLAAGQELDVRLQYQVNPTAVGGRGQGVALEDGPDTLVRLAHRMQIFP